MTRSIASSSSDLADLGLVPPGGEDRGLVDEVGEVGSGEAGCLPGEGGGRDVVLKRLAHRVHVEDLLAAFDVRPVDHDLAVETPRA